MLTHLVYNVVVLSLSPALGTLLHCVRAEHVYGKRDAHDQLKAVGKLKNSHCTGSVDIVWMQPRQPALSLCVSHILSLSLSLSVSLSLCKDWL